MNQFAIFLHSQSKQIVSYEAGGEIKEANNNL
jgi:hypothetical protein